MTRFQSESRSICFFHSFILCFFSLLIFFVVFCAKNDNTGSDPRSSLLVTRTLIEKLTLKLDGYGKALKKYGDVIHSKNGHSYYFFPLGTSICSIPFVAAAHLAGYDMLDYEKQTQKLIAAFLSVLIFLLLFHIAGLFMGLWESLFFSLIFWFGSAYSSTMGTALWSHNFAAVFSLAALSGCLKAYFNRKPANSFLIALCLFFAYLCRPTLALLSPVVLLVIFTLDKKASLKIMVYICLQLIIFSIFSLIEFRQILPDYYIPSRIKGLFQIDAFAGNLISPSRGILVYSSFLLLPLLFPVKAWQALKEHKKLAIFLIWPLLHLISISKFPHWWGGWSYGSRLMSDILPAAYLVCVLVYAGLDKKRFALIFLFLTGIFSIYINTFQGLYNPYALIWQAAPAIDGHTEYLFDWRYPPFSYDSKKHEKRMWEYQLRQLSSTPLEPGRKYSSKDSTVIFSGWKQASNGEALSPGQNSRIYFYWDDKNAFSGNLVLSAVSSKPLQVSVSLNKTQIGAFTITEKDTPLSLSFSRDLLRQNKINSMGFECSSKEPDSDLSEIRFQYFELS